MRSWIGRRSHLAAPGVSELWRPDAQWLEAAQDDATRLAIRAQEQAGLDILTDGEIRLGDPIAAAAPSSS